MQIIMHSENTSLIFYYTKFSVLMSTFAVASSSTNILQCLTCRMARAKLSNCDCPAEKIEFYYVICVSNLAGRLSTVVNKSTAYKLECISSNENCDSGSRFYRIVPEMVNGCYGIKHNWDRNYLRVIYYVSSPWNKIFPEESQFRSLNNTCMRELFPAPVLPTTPIFYFLFIWNEIPFST